MKRLALILLFMAIAAVSGCGGGSSNPPVSAGDPPYCQQNTNHCSCADGDAQCTCSLAPVGYTCNGGN